MSRGHIKVTVMIPAHLVDFITEQSERHDLSQTEEINEALNDYKFFRQKQDRGAKIIVESPDGTCEEVLPRH